MEDLTFITIFAFKKDICPLKRNKNTKNIRYGFTKLTHKQILIFIFDKLLTLHS